MNREEYYQKEYKTILRDYVEFNKKMNVYFPQISFNVDNNGNLIRDSIKNFDWEEFYSLIEKSEEIKQKLINSMNTLRSLSEK